MTDLKDYINNQIISLSVLNTNYINLIKERYKNLKVEKDLIINIDQGAVYITYEYVKLAEKIGFIRSMSPVAYRLKYSN